MSGIVVVLAGIVVVLSVVTAAELDMKRMIAQNGPSEVDTEELSAYVRNGGTSEADAIAKIESVPGVRGAHVQRFLGISPQTGPERLAEAIIGDCYTIRSRAIVDDCAEGDVFILEQPLPAELADHPDEIYLPAAGDRVRYGAVVWTIPADAKVARPIHDEVWENEVLITPAAAPKGVNAEYMSVLLETDVAAAEFNDLVERVRNQFGLTSAIHIGGETYDSAAEQRSETVGRPSTPVPSRCW